MSSSSVASGLLHEARTRKTIRQTKPLNGLFIEEGDAKSSVIRKGMNQEPKGILNSTNAITPLSCTLFKSKYSMHISSKCCMAWLRIYGFHGAKIPMGSNRPLHTSISDAKTSCQMGFSTGTPGMHAKAVAFQSED
jgi:hypothetical protein